MRIIINTLKTIEHDFQSFFDANKQEDPEVKKHFKPFGTLQMIQYLQSIKEKSGQQKID